MGPLILRTSCNMFVHKQQRKLYFKLYCLNLNYMKLKILSEKFVGEMACLLKWRSCQLCMLKGFYVVLVSERRQNDCILMLL